MTAQTSAQRQAASKARFIAAGLRVFKVWAHPADHAALAALAAKLARKRARMKDGPL